MVIPAAPPPPGPSHFPWPIPGLPHDSFFQFIIHEEQRHEGMGLHNNRFSAVFRSAYEMYDVLMVTRARHDADLAAYIEAARPHLDAMTTHKQPLEGAIQRRFAARPIERLLKADALTYYMVANVLLDRIAAAIQTYFGHPQRFTTHDAFAKRFKAYCDAKRIVIPEGMIEAATRLREEVGDYRDHEIVHDRKPGRSTSVGLRADPPLYVISRTGFTMQDGKMEIFSSNSTFVPELGDLIDQYIALVMRLIADNRKLAGIKVKAGYA